MTQGAHALHSLSPLPAKSRPDITVRMYAAPLSSPVTVCESILSAAIQTASDDRSVSLTPAIQCRVALAPGVQDSAIVPAAAPAVADSPLMSPRGGGGSMAVAATRAVTPS